MLTAGKWPGPPHPAGPLPVALPVTVASRLHLKLGALLKVAAPSGPAAAGMRVTGLFRPRNPASPYWALDLVPVSGFGGNAVSGSGLPGSLLVYGPAVVSPAAFRSGLAVGQASWFVLPQASAMARQGISALAGSTSHAVAKLTVALPSGLQVTTRLRRLLAGIAGTIVLARSLFTIGALARLATMGLRRWQAQLLLAAETLPQVVAATVGGIACAWLLVPLVGPSVNLAAFTQAGPGVTVIPAPFPLAASAIGLVLAALLVLAAQAVATYRRGSARALRIAE